MYRCVVSARRWALVIPLSFLAACMGATSSPTMIGAHPAPSPLARLDACNRDPSMFGCRPPLLTPQRMDQLQRVQRELSALERSSDADRFRRSDVWTAAGSQGGDCEDLALAARARLMSLGWPPRSLRLAMAWTEKRVYHAVLTVDVEHRGRLSTFVLDSRFGDVRGWDELSARGYKWDRRQAAGKPYWVTVATPGAATVVASRS